MNFRTKDLVRKLLDVAKKAGEGHIGSALSVVDIIDAVYDVIKPTRTVEPDADRFVLSKGHAALALYSVLWKCNVISESELDSYCQNESLFGVHPEPFTPGVDFGTGSLGTGVTYAGGSALGIRMRGSTRRVICLLSDSELNEGSTWEALMFAGHRRLANLTVVLDQNEQQALGYTADIQDTANVAQRVEMLGWETQTVDGHSFEELRGAIDTITDKPRFIVAKTILGHGVSFMERKILWHYKSLSEAEYATALNEVSRAK